MRVKYVLPVLGALALLVPIAKAEACIVNAPAAGSAVVACSGFSNVLLSPPPLTSGPNYVMEFVGDGSSLHAQVQFYLAGFNTAWPPTCWFGPQVGTASWPAAGPDRPEFQGGGSTIVGGQRIAYFDFSFAKPLGLGTTVYLSGSCPN